MRVLETGLAVISELAGVINMDLIIIVHQANFCLFCVH